LVETTPEASSPTLQEQDAPKVRLIEIMLAVGTFVAIVAALSFTPNDYLLELLFGVLLAVFIVAIVRSYVNLYSKDKARNGLWNKIMTISFGWLILFPIVALVVDVAIQDRVSLYGKILSAVLSVSISFGIGGLWFGLLLAKFFGE
jgi:hypothetical protein